MTRRKRKLIGAAAMLLFAIGYALLAMALAQAESLQRAPTLVQAVVFAVLGLAWILPLMPLIAWMERGGPGRK